jgi:hypothetical protein
VAEIASDLQLHVDMCEDGRVSWYATLLHCTLCVRHSTPSCLMSRVRLKLGLIRGHLDARNATHRWEFDVFCQLFQPWDRILNTWGVLTKMHPGYKAWVTYEQVQQELEPLLHKPGSYCYRLSATRCVLFSVHVARHASTGIPDGVH